MFVFTVLLLACIVQTLLNYFRIISIPYTAFLLFGGFAWGFCILNFNELEDLTEILSVPPSSLLILYISIITFRSSFCLDVHTFCRCFGQVFVISVIVSMLTGAITGILVKVITQDELSFVHSIFFGFMCIPTYPALFVRLLRITGSNTKQVDILLESEFLISSSILLTVNHLIIGYINGYIVEWYQIVASYLRLSLVGILTGLTVGYLGRFVIRRVYQDILNTIAIIFGIPVTTGILTYYYFGGNSILAILTVGLLMARERAVLSKKAEMYLSDFWKILAAGTDIIITVYVACVAIIYVYPYMYWYQLLLAVTIYFLYFIIRFFSFLIFFPALSKLNYGLSFSNMLVCVWGGSKSCMNLLLVLENRQYSQMTDDEARLFFCFLIVLQTLSYFINGTTATLLLKRLGLIEISMARKINMNNCMKHVFAKRDRTIATLKMDRFLADTNWPMVNEATNMKHPYRAKLNKFDENDDFFLGYRYTTCPDCQNELAGEPTAKELKEMTREARLRILKTTKMSFARQYENGMLSKHGLRILNRTIDDTMDTEKAILDIDNFCNKLMNEGCCNRFIRNRARTAAENRKKIIYKVPKRHCRRMCYYIVTHKSFEPIMVVIVLLNMIPVIVIIHSLATHTQFNAPWRIGLTIVQFLFYFIYLTEFVVKVLGYSWISIRRDGIPTYFKNCFNLLDFTVLIGATVEVIMDLTVELNRQGEKISGIVLEGLRFFRLFRLLRVFETIYVRVIKRLDTNLNLQLTASYELCKTFVTSEDEVLAILPHIIDHEKIQQNVRHEIEKDRQHVLELLGMIQRDRPWIAITVKTKQAMKTLVNTMKETQLQLKCSGRMDDDEYDNLMKSIQNLYKKINLIKCVHASAPKIIFREVAWMAGDEILINYLFNNIVVRVFEPQDIIFRNGDLADGIYVVIAGLLMLNYEPQIKVIDHLEEYGILPIVDYVPCSQFREVVVDYLATGNTVGELSILTNRPYNCTISAITHTQTYVLTRAVIEKAMRLSSDPINGLRARMWKAWSIKIAIPILSSVPAYHALRPDQIKYALERAFIPDLSEMKLFAVTDIVQDLLLIEGVAVDFNTRELYTAPCYIPRTVQKLILPASSLMNIPIDLKTKLMIVPEPNFIQADIIMSEEEGCSMVSGSPSPSQCLQHTVLGNQKRKSESDSKRSSHITEEWDFFEVPVKQVYSNETYEVPSFTEVSPMETNYEKTEDDSVIALRKRGFRSRVMVL